MKRFDYIGDAVWELAWRKFENENFSEMTGWHRTLRKQLVTCNVFMGMISVTENIKPYSDSEKSGADALEDYLGKTEIENHGEGLKKSLEIM